MGTICRQPARAALVALVTLGALVTLAALASLGAGVGSASAQMDGRLNADLFKRLDADGNGRVTLAELVEADDARARRVDANGDGYVTKAEYRAFREKRLAARGKRLFDLLDRNGDGQLTEAELERRPRWFRRIDGNGDGVITLAEVRAAQQRLITRRMSIVFSRLDSDGDGRISTAERRQGVTQRFSRLDANGDGLLTPAELTRPRRRN